MLEFCRSSFTRLDKNKYFSFHEQSSNENSQRFSKENLEVSESVGFFFEKDRKWKTWKLRREKLYEQKKKKKRRERRKRDDCNFLKVKNNLHLGNMVTFFEICCVRRQIIFREFKFSRFLSIFSFSSRLNLSENFARKVRASAVVFEKKKNWRRTREMKVAARKTMASMSDRERDKALSLETILLALSTKNQNSFKDNLTSWLIFPLLVFNETRTKGKRKSVAATFLFGFRKLEAEATILNWYTTHWRSLQFSIAI